MILLLLKIYGVLGWVIFLILTTTFFRQKAEGLREETYYQGISRLFLACIVWPWIIARVIKSYRKEDEYEGNQ